MFKKIYGIYDLEENLLFKGTQKECCEFANANPSTFRDSVKYGCVLYKKYLTDFLYKEDMTPDEKKCTRCGKVLPIEQMYHMKRGDIYQPLNKCYECYLKDKKEYRKGKKNEI